MLQFSMVLGAAQGCWQAAHEWQTKRCKMPALIAIMCSAVLRQYPKLTSQHLAARMCANTMTTSAVM